MGKLVKSSSFRMASTLLMLFLAHVRPGLGAPSVAAMDSRNVCPEACYQKVRNELYAEQAYQASLTTTSPSTAAPSSTATCPCVKPPGSNECVPYDSRLQATSLDEALFKFPNLGNYLPEESQPLVSAETETSQARPIPMTPMVAQELPTFKSASASQPGEEQPSRVVPVFVSAGAEPPAVLSPMVGGTSMKMATSKLKGFVSTQPATEDYSCTSAQCLSCKAMVLRGFAQSANVSVPRSEGDDGDASHAEAVCMRSQPQKPPTQQSSSTTSNALSAQDYNQLMSILMPKNRQKRDTTKANSTDQPSLGVATKIGCTYKKGDEISAGWTGLCSLCWQWRKLPDEYFPAFLNEVACDNSDQGCLSGFGGCRAVLRAINVLHNLGTAEVPQWEQQSISTIVGCECQVEVGTPLHSLVMR